MLITRRKILPAVLAFALIAVLLAVLTHAKAAGNTYNCDISKGSVTISDSAVSYYDAAGVNCTPAYSAGDTYVISGSSTTNTVAVSGSANVNITLSSVNIDVSATNDACAFSIGSSASVELTLNRSNKLISGESRAGLQVPSGAKLTISGGATDTLTAAGGLGGAGIGGGEGSTGSDDGNGGTITINGGTVTAGGSRGAGIGGGCNGDNDSVTINGGKITATGGLGSAGIGSGIHGACGAITISGGTVTADSIGLDGSCVISGGSVNVNSMVPTPTNGSDTVYLTTVTAYGIIASTDVTYSVDGSAPVSCATDAGGKLYLWLPAPASQTPHSLLVSASSNKAIAALCVDQNNTNTATTNDVSYGSIAITEAGSYKLQGVTTANTISAAPNITGAVNATINNVSIDVSAVNNACAFSIGTGSTVNLTLSGTNTLKSSPHKAGLSAPSGAVLNLTAGSTADSLTATATSLSGGSDVSDGAGIGGDADGNSGTVTISGGTVTARGAMSAAGIGSGFHNIGDAHNNSGTVTISGGKVYAYGGSGGAGIGGGRSDNGTVTISGGEVNAYGSGSAGIGGGVGGNGGTVTISGGKVYAYGGNIGGGSGGPNSDGGDGGTVTISGGTVTAASIGGGSGGNGSVGGAGSCVITGGSVNVNTMGPIPTNGSSTVYLTTVTLDDMAGAPVTSGFLSALTARLSGSAYAYGIKDMYTDTDGKLYLYLPDNAVTSEAGSAGVRYTGSVTTAITASASKGTLTENPLMSVSPSGTGAPVSGNIVLTFSKAMKTDLGTVSLDGGTAILTGGSWSADSKTYTVPYSDLGYGTTYTITLSGFKDAAGNTMDNNSAFDFTAIAQPSGGNPANVPSYTITATAGIGGSIDPSGTAAFAYGSSKTYTIKAYEGYAIKDILVDGTSVGAAGAYTFTNIIKAHTIQASFTKVTVNPFIDVSQNDWFYGNVIYVYENGMMRGINDNTFSPNGTMTRAMFVTVLYRMSGDTGSYTGSFADVPADAWYGPAVRWALANGIAGGVGNNRFDPDGILTREQLALLLYNYALYMKLDVTVTSSGALSGYTDVSDIDAWAKTAMTWAVSNGIITGDGASLHPQSSATRAEAAAMLQRFAVKLGV